MKYKLKLKEIDKNFKTKDLMGNKMPIYNINYHQKKAFQTLTAYSNKYIFDSFDCALKMVKNNKLLGIINCPISKEHLLKKKYRGITEYLSAKTKRSGSEVMLIYNTEFAVVPITTHIPIKEVSSSLKINDIVNKVKTTNKFYKQKLKKTPKIGILGLNPHNFSNFQTNGEQKTINKAISKIKKNKIKVIGPISPDTGFLIRKKLNLDLIVGMYHDQVLIPFKTLFGFDAINVTLGLPFIRVSPDHGVAKDLVGKNKANPVSLIECIKFFNSIK